MYLKNNNYVYFCSSAWSITCVISFRDIAKYIFQIKWVMEGYGRWFFLHFIIFHRQKNILHISVLFFFLRCWGYFFCGGAILHRNIHQTIVYDGKTSDPIQITSWNISDSLWSRSQQERCLTFEWFPA